METSNITSLVKILAKIAYVILISRGYDAVVAQSWIELGIEAALTILAIAADIWASNKKTVEVVKNASPFIIVGFLLFGLFGCNATPRQRYSIDAPLSVGARIGLDALHSAGKVSDATFNVADPKVKQALTDVSAAYIWIGENQVLADTPGAPCPPLDDLRTLIPFIAPYAVGLPPIAPPPRPTTLPSIKPGE